MQKQNGWVDGLFVPFLFFSVLLLNLQLQGSLQGPDVLPSSSRCQVCIPGLSWGCFSPRPLCYFSFISQWHSSPQQLQFFLFLPFLQTALLRKPSAIICSLCFLPICFLSFAVSLWPWEDRQTEVVDSGGQDGGNNFLLHLTAASQWWRSTSV